jgi:hypothetical protein
MKLRVIYLLSGVVGVAVLLMLPVTQTVLVLDLHPQTSISSPHVPHLDNTMPSLPRKLALSEAQKEQITKLNWGINFEIDKILNIEQQKEFKNALDQDLRISSVLEVISISKEQRNKILNLFHFAQRQVKQILSPEQIDYIDQQQKNQLKNKQPKNLELNRKLNREAKKHYVNLPFPSRTPAQTLVLGILLA